MLARPSQSLALRFLLQPTISTILAIRDGLRDARTGRPPYFWTVMSTRYSVRRACRRSGSNGEALFDGGCRERRTNA